MAGLQPTTSSADILANEQDELDSSIPSSAVVNSDGDVTESTREIGPEEPMEGEESSLEGENGENMEVQTSGDGEMEDVEVSTSEAADDDTSDHKGKRVKVSHTSPYLSFDGKCLKIRD